MDDLLTEEDYRVAKSNGISRELAYHRYYVGWEKERAITEPPQKGRRGIWHLYRTSCEKLGISQKTFSKRMERGMTARQAFTTPLDTKFHKRSTS